jgi:hypothetical protein
MNLGDNPLLIDVSPRRRTLQFVAYGEYLCAGGTYYFKRVKCSTIALYLQAAATLVSSVTREDPRKDDATDKGNGKAITALLDGYKKWETMPDRREPWTPELQRNLDNHITKLPPSNFSLLEVVSDFTATGLYTGCRVSEYAQSNDGDHTIGAHKRDPADFSPVAFTLNDITFHQRKRPISHQSLVACASVETALDTVDSVSIRWTTQKNGTRGEIKIFHRNPKCQGLCPVYRFLRIVRRFVQYMGHRPDIPVSVYKGPGGIIRNVTRTKIDTVLQDTVCRVFKLDKIKNKEIVGKWTSHSIRVGACNILFGAGESDHVIKFRLRWKSMTFMNYFRNLGAISAAQNAAVQKAIEQPELFY